MPGLSFMESRALSKRAIDGLIGEGCGPFWSTTLLPMSVISATEPVTRPPSSFGNTDWDL